MTEGETSQPRAPLLMWPILRNTCLHVWANRQHFGRLLIVPIILGTLLSFAYAYWHSIADTASNLFEVSSWLAILPYYLIFTFLAVSCHRSILIGEHSVSRFGVYGWTMRETRFFLFLIAIYATAWIIAIIYGIVLGFGISLAATTIKGLIGEPPEFFKDPFISYILMTTAAIPFAYIIGRSSLVLPAIAVDLRPGMDAVWTYSEGNGWRVTILVGAIPLVASAAYGLFVYAIQWMAEFSLEQAFQWRGTYSVGLAGLQSVFYYAFATVEIAILSLTFKELSGWQPSEEPAASES